MSMESEQIQDIEAIPVHIESSNARPIRPAAAEFGTTMTWSVDTLANMGQPLRILTERYRRSKAKIYIPSYGPTGLTVSAQGTQNAPAANTQIVNIPSSNIQAGTYIIRWTVGLDGTTGGNEVDNFQLRIGATTVTTAVNAKTVGTYPQTDYGPVFLTGTQAVVIRSGNAAATAGSIYMGQLTLDPVFPSQGSSAIWLSSRQEDLMNPQPVGMVFASPVVIEWENRRPCYAIAGPNSTAVPIQVVVLDQSYEET